MESAPPLPQSVSTWTFCARNWIPTALCVIFLMGWHFGVTREVTVAAALFFSILCAACHLAGTLVLRVLPVSSSPNADYPFAFLLGYFFVGSSLFLLALVSPLGVKFNLAAVVVAIAVWAAATRIVPSDLSDGKPFNPGNISIVIGLIAATLWAQDSIQPLALSASEPSLTHWPDSFFHARVISIFANQGPGAPIQSMSAAGEPAALYHYASYMLPAALSAFTATPAYSVFGSFMLPAGIFLTGLAAYGIGNSFWGKEGGVAATAALLLLPDAAQQGIHNYWYSYHFLQQVGSAQLFGVAIMAAAWVYMFDACKTGRVVSLGAGYVLAAGCVMYKAQFFIANAFLIWVFPALFFGAVSVKKRMIWVASCGLSYWLALKLAEEVPSVPTIELDGRGLLRSSKWIIQNFDSATIREYLAQFLPQIGDSRLYSLVWVVAMSAILIVITFGCFAPLYFALAWRLRKAASRMVLLFPLLIIVVYMIMSVGLAPNIKGNPDELLHRPFVWAYFVVCTWVGGAAWLAVSNWLPRRSLRRIAMAIVPLLFLVPWTFGKAIEVGPSRLWNNYHTWWNVPVGLVQAAYYIREHSRVTDIVQDSRGDGRLILSGLAERQPYVQQWGPPLITENRPQRKIIYDRFAQITQFKNLTDQTDIIEFVRRYSIRWFVVHPEDVLGWPRSVTDNPRFESGGYRVYEFAL